MCGPPLTPPKEENMRQNANKSRSRGSYKQRVSKTAKLNTMHPRRGGIRL